MLNASLKFQEQNFKFGGSLNPKQNQKVKKHWFYKQNNSSARASDFLVQPQQQQQQLRTCITLFGKFRWRELLDHDVKPPIATLDEVINRGRVFRFWTWTECCRIQRLNNLSTIDKLSGTKDIFRVLTMQRNTGWYNSKSKTLKTGRKRLWNGSRTEQKEHKHKVSHLLLNLCERLRLGLMSFIPKILL